MPNIIHQQDIKPSGHKHTPNIIHQQDIKPSGHKHTPNIIRQQTGHQAIQQSASCAPTGDPEVSCLNSDLCTSHMMNWQLIEATDATDPSSLA